VIQKAFYRSRDWHGHGLYGPADVWQTGLNAWVIKEAPLQIFNQGLFKPF